MSFIAGRLAATEGAYFLQESKHAVGRLSEKKLSPHSNPSIPTKTREQEAGADVLHEVLRHSLPIKPFHYQETSIPPVSTTSKWKTSASSSLVPSSLSSSSDAHNPLRAVLCLPQVTFGPRRWNLPNQEHSVLASTANELRRDRHTSVDSKKVKAAEEGLSQVGKSLAIATTFLFGGATLTFVFTAHKLQLYNSDDIRTKGRVLLQPSIQTIREQVGPLRDWAEQMSRKWHYKGEEEANKKPIIIKELSKRLGAKTPN